MKNTIKKIAASISAAVLCALPVVNSLTANAYAGPDARYTFRKNYACSSNYHIKDVVFSWSINSNGTSAPQANAIASGTFINGNSGAQNRHIGAGTYSPKNNNVVGGLFSQSFYSTTPNFTEYSNTIYTYNTSGNLVSGAVSAGPTFLVGDLNLDKAINEDDFQILYSGIRSKTNNFSTSYKFSYFGIMNVVVGNVGHNYSPYAFDINDDGYLSQADVNMFLQYLSSSTYRFAK